MKKCSKLLSFILALTMIFGVIVIAPVTASALDDGVFTYTVNDGKATITGVVDPDNIGWVVTVPASINGSPVTAIGAEAFLNVDEIGRLDLPDGLETIGARAFYNTDFESYIIIPESVTAIGEKAFGYGERTDRSYTVTLVGKPGSAAQAYAQANQMPFIDVDKYSSPDYNSNISLDKANDRGEIALDGHGDPQEEYNVLQKLEVGALPEGVTFDIETFTLTLTDFRRPDMLLIVHTFGPKYLTIAVSGECQLGSITVICGVNGAKIRFDGTGMLTVNPNKVFNQSLYMNSYAEPNDNNRPQAFFGSDVRLKFFGKENSATAMGNAENYNPYIAENGSQIESTSTRYSYKEEQYLYGKILARSIPGHAYPNFIGDLVNNANDPNGHYCSPDGDYVYQYVYDEANDVYLLDSSTAPAAWDSDIHSYVKDQYDNLVGLRTRDYFTSTYYRVAYEGQEYLVAHYNCDGLSDQSTVAIECSAYRFSYIGGSAVDSEGCRYAVIDEDDPVEITLYGPAATTSAPTELLETVTVLGFYDSNVEYLKYKATSNADPNGIYGFDYDRDENDEPTQFNVYRLSYNEALNHYFFDNDFECVELSPNDFFAAYTPAYDEYNNFVWITNPERYSDYNGYLYADGDGNEYACTLDTLATTHERVITGVYYKQEIPEISTESDKQYYFEPVDLQNMGEGFVESLRPVTKTVVTDYYYYTLPSEFGYNLEPVQVQPIDLLDVGNVWTFELISGNPDCEPCYIPFTAEVHPDIEGAYIEDEIWTNTVDGSTSSRKDPQPLKPGCAYDYTVVVNVHRGYEFSDNMAFTYLGQNAPNATLTFSEDRKAVTITGLERITFLLDQPSINSIEPDVNGAKIKINSSKGASKYRIFRKEGKKAWMKIADTAATSYVDKTAVSGTKYTYTVRCISADGTRYESTYDNAGKAFTYVAAPKITKFENVNSGTKLTWSVSKGAAMYRVFVKNGKKWTILGDTKGTSIIATKRSSGVKYTYTVRAMNVNKQYVSAYNTTGWSYTFIAAPALPKLVNTRSGVLINYTKPKGGVYFRIFRKQAGSGWKKLVDTSSIKIVDKSAKNGVRYWYTVRCISKDGKQFYSGYNTSGRAIVCKR